MYLNYYFVETQFVLKINKIIRKKKSIERNAFLMNQKAFRTRSTTRTTIIKTNIYIISNFNINNNNNYKKQQIIIII